MNQQQLQTARAALWHQSANALGAPESSAALATYDDAAAWLGEIGFCLFLPRHAQLPAPAPSFVEACMGAARALPPPDAIAQATDLADRLVDAGRAVPLNLLGAPTEQPDFLVTSEALPWVAAIRGDRQWKAAPAGRTSPLVVRTWEALDREGESTAVELQEILGRELTQSAVLRALIELWTSFRAIPFSAPGQPTRWTLLKHRHPTELATAANTGQATALSALLSIYLRSAVAATAEEAEVFLSPLTSRSRIREVLHGMMAARQFGTMSVASQTMLFVEGSLPEIAPEAESEPARTASTIPSPARSALFRNETEPGQRRAPERKPVREPRERPAYERTETRTGSKNRAEKSFERSSQKPFRKFDKRPFPRAADGGPRRGEQNSRVRSGKGTAKPWRRSAPKFGRQESGGRAPRPSQRTGSGVPKDPKDRFRAERRPGPQRPWREKSAQGSFRNPFGKEDRVRAGNRPAESDRPRRGPSAPPRKFPGTRKPGARKARFAPPGPSRSGSSRPDSSGEFTSRSAGASGNRPGRPFRQGQFASTRPGSRPSNGGNRPQRPGDRPERTGQPFKRSFKRPLRKANSSPSKQNPRNNRNQEETPE